MTALCQQHFKKYQVFSIRYQDYLNLLFYKI